MGGAVSSVGNVIGGVGGAVNNVVQKVPGIGPVLGPAAGIALGQNPISAFGSSLTSNISNGGGGGASGGGSSSTPMYAQPNISYGANTYQVGENPVDASPYFISGDKGVYNLLPAFGQVNTGTSLNSYKPPPLARSQVGKNFGKQGAYTPYEAYNDVLSKMTGDQKAIDAFQAAYKPVMPAYDRLGGSRGSNLFGKYVNYNLDQAVPNQPGLTYKNLADYAAKQNNPFFLPYATTTGATPTSFTPSENALAQANINPYSLGNRSFSTSNTPAPVTPAPVIPTPTPALAPVTSVPNQQSPVAPQPQGLASLRGPTLGRFKQLSMPEKLRRK